MSDINIAHVVIKASLYGLILSNSSHILRMLICLISRASLVLRASITIMVSDFRHSLWPRLEFQLK